MEKNIIKKGLVLGVIFLFLGVSFFPTISGCSIENKTDLLESRLQSPLETKKWIIGFMQIINETSEYIEVINIFGFWITNHSYGGFFERNETLQIYGFIGISRGYVVLGTFDYIVRP